LAARAAESSTVLRRIGSRSDWDMHGERTEGRSPHRRAPAARSS
jgi:hypothetical protein